MQQTMINVFNTRHLLLYFINLFVCNLFIYRVYYCVFTGPTFDPFLITGSLAHQVVDIVLRHGILYFHEIRHEPLLLGNNLERIENNLIPHRLGSIRPGHPFFNFNK